MNNKQKRVATIIELKKSELQYVFGGNMSKYLNTNLSATIDSIGKNKPDWTPIPIKI